MRIIFPIAGFGSTASVQDVVARSLVGMPEFVRSIGEAVCEFRCRSLDSEFCHNLEESEVHIDIVVKTGIFHKSFTDVIVAPENGLGILDQATLEFEFGRASVCAADGLCEPAAANPVHHFIFAHAYGLPIFQRVAGAGHRQQRKQDYA